MTESSSTGQDLVMPMRPFRSSPDRALATSAHQLQRVGGTFQSHAGSPNAVPTHAVTLAHVEETLDRLAVALDQMAKAVAEWCGHPSAVPEEATLPPEARAVRWHLQSTAQQLRDCEEACAISREWTWRLLTTVPPGGEDSDVPRGELRPLRATRESWRQVTSSQTGRKRPAADDAKWS